MRIETALHEEIRKELDELGRLELGSDTYRATVDGVTKLMDRAIEIDKFNREHENNEENRELDKLIKFRQMRDERRDQNIKNVISVFAIAVPAALTVWGTIKSIRFEQEGTITTIMGRGFISKLLPKK